MELLEQTVKNQKIALNFQTADAIWSFCPCQCIYIYISYTYMYLGRFLVNQRDFFTEAIESQSYLID